MRRLENQRAFVLLSVMMVVLVLGMILRVAILRMPSASGLSRQAINERYARRAAQSGLAVALTKLREDNSWPGMTSEPIKIQEPEVLTVEEKQGNVLGTITEPDGTISEFRIRFNYQNGNAGNDPDGLPDPTDPAMSFDTPYVSVNNLDSTDPAVVPRGVGVNSKVVEPDKGHLIPEVSVSLAVEGRTLGSHGQVLAKHVTEAVYVLTAKDEADDAVIMAGGGLNIELQRGGALHLGAQKIDKTTPAISRLRSKQGLNATADGSPAKIKLQQGRKVEFSYNSAQVNNVPQLLNQVPDGRASEVEERGQDFYSLPSNAVKKASPGSKTAELKAGTYVFRRNGNNNTLVHYAVEYDEYKKGLTPEELSKGTIVNFDFKNVRQDPTTNSFGDRLNVQSKTFEAAGEDVNGLLLTIKDVDVKVQPVGAVKGFALIPETEVPFEHNEHHFVDKTLATPDRLLVRLTNTTLSTEGDLTIYGGIAGKSATLTSDGNVKLLAGRKLSLERGESQGDDTEEEQDDQDERERDDRNAALQLNIYAQSDLEISSYSAVIRKGSGGYRDLNFKGLLYSWGDVTIHAAYPESTNKDGAALKLKGSLVAYGNDPTSSAPGGGIGQSNGKVTIKAKKANLNWDPSFFNLAAVQGGSQNVGFSKYSVSFPKP